jgi:predicted TIM-barrel fold metal-dependent hydrolase
MYSQRELLPWARLATAGIPVLDAHVHAGLADPAGLLATYEEVLAALREADARGVVFALKDPAGYRQANDEALARASNEPELRAAFCRIVPDDDPTGEARRLVRAGAAGIKLHPRGDDFALDDKRLDGVFAFANEERLPVLVHTGPGDPDSGPMALQRARRNPEARLILAHCAVGCFEQVAGAAGDLPNVFFDTAWWNPSDVWALFHRVRPSRILYASDIPFSSPAESIVITARIAREAGLSDEQLACVMGGQLDRLLRREDPLEVGGLVARAAVPDPGLERLYVTLCTAVEPMLRGEPAGQGADLARAACAEPEGPHAELIASIGRLLDLASKANSADPLRSSRTPGFDLVLAAAVLARTPSVPVP